MKRILVVDDTAENRYLLVVMLQAYGYEVLTANDGAEALICGRRHRPDLVISDILMPVMDGFALCRQWHEDEQLRGIPFLFYTATYTDARDEQLAMDLGADRYVVKPQEPRELMTIIEELLARDSQHLAKVMASLPPVDETVKLREYNESLVRKLEKKLTELEATREALESDIRQRHHIEAALRQSQERWQLIYDTEPECVKVVSADGRLEAMNPAGLAMIEADLLDEVHGIQVLDLIVPEHRDAFLAMHRGVIGGQSRQLTFEISGRRGRRLWLETHAAPLHNADGSISHLAITRDISENKRASAELAANQVRLESLSRQLLATQESERKSLSRELHDEIGQALTGIQLNLKALQQPTLTPDLSAILRETMGLVDQTLQQVRDISLNLRPSMLDDLGLVPALRWCLDRQAQRAGYVPHFLAEPSLANPPALIATACFRIAQESLTNIARHAQAQQVRVEIRQHETEWELLVHDNGVGFDVSAACDRAARGESAGLLGMRERAELLGGQFDIESRPSAGTTIHARFPLRFP